MNDKAENLLNFFNDPLNTVTRERIYFNRLSFDLTIAAAREGYHLNLYEPDVDRDGFDIVAEDQDRIGWYQTKAALAGAGTARWDIRVDLLRPAQAAAEAFGWDPVEAGRGGGVILIEIDDESAEGRVSYRYTDFDILVAIAEGFVTERCYKGRGRPAESARKEAVDLISTLRTTPRGQKVVLTKRQFITVKQSDDLLGLMGLRSRVGYGMFAIRNAHGHVRVDEHGFVDNVSANDLGILHHHMVGLCSVQPMEDRGSKIVLFDPFDWNPRSSVSI